MALISSMSSVERLKQEYKVVRNTVETFPAMEKVLQQFSPMMVIFLNAM